MKVAERGVRAFALASVAVGAFLAACASEDAAQLTKTNRSPGSEAGASATQPDGGPTDAADSAPITAADSCAGRAICDSFESGDLGFNWTKRTNNGTVEVTTAQAFRGTHSVKVSTQAVSYQQAYLVNQGAPLFPLQTNVLYGKMMVLLENPAAKDVHWTMLSGDGPVAGKNTDAFYRYGGQPQGAGAPQLLMANYDTTNNVKTDCWQHSATVMPIGKWVCFAWTLDGTKNEMHVAMDGKAIADLDMLQQGEGCIGNDLGGKWLAPTFSSTTLGWESYQQDIGHTMYIDDVVLDTQPVACP